MRIAIAGSRGVPARYGGFETFAEELSAGLTGLGHEVHVYCRTSLYDEQVWQPQYRGTFRRPVWAPRQKYLETVVSTAIAILDATVRVAPDVVLMVNGINAWCSFVPRLRGIPVVLNVAVTDRAC